MQYCRVPDTELTPITDDVSAAIVGHSYVVMSASAVASIPMESIGASVDMYRFDMLLESLGTDYKRSYGVSMACVAAIDLGVSLPDLLASVELAHAQILSEREA